MKEKAIRAPRVIIQKFDSPNYETEFLSALAFFSDIVKEDMTSSAVVWNDDKEGVIINIAKGEHGIDKLAEFFLDDSDQTRLVLQEISKRIDKKKNTSDAPTAVAKNNPADAKIIKSQADEIAELKAKLAAKENSAPETKNVAAEVTADEIDVVDEAEAIEEKTDEEVDVDDMTMEQAKAAYLEKFEKAVPSSQNKNLAWIKSKLAE